MTNEARFWSKVQRGAEAECWPWKAYKTGPGYGQFRRDTARGMVLAHRYAMELAHGEFDPSLHVLHRCDNPPCVNPAHLYLGNNADNVADRERRGRHHDCSGELNGRCRLTAECVRDIRDALKSGETRASLAREYRVGWTTINHIAEGTTWRFVG